MNISKDQIIPLRQSQQKQDQARRVGQQPSDHVDTDDNSRHADLRNKLDVDKNNPGGPCQAL